MTQATPPAPFDRRAAYLIILLFGLVSLFGDIIYEGARSVTGPYLFALGGSALVVGIVAGLGEFLGYALRLVSGRLADATRRYWTFTFLGYGMLIAVPLLALAGSWEVAALLFILERIGKGIRAPAKDAILSNVTAGIGRGWGFGIHEALDQIGAVIGPVILSTAFFLRGDYRVGFALLLIPFAMMMLALTLTRSRAPAPAAIETATRPAPQAPPPRARSLTGSSPPSPWPALSPSRSSPTTLRRPASSRERRSPCIMPLRWVSTPWSPSPQGGSTTVSVSLCSLPSR
jgi:hypothetical protein